MKISSVPSPLGLNVLLIALLFAGVFFAFMTGRRLPLISSERGTMLALLVLGFAMCTIGGSGRVAALNAWTHPLSILGMLLGAIILVIALASVFGAKLPLIQNGTQAVMIVTALVIAKVAISLLHSLLTRAG